MRGIPLDNNDMIKAYINKLAKDTNIHTTPYPNVTELPPDNGEVFLSQYCQEQIERNKQHLTHKKLSICMCNKCQTCRHAIDFEQTNTYR